MRVGQMIFPATGAMNARDKKLLWKPHECVDPEYLSTFILHRRDNI